MAFSKNPTLSGLLGSRLPLFPLDVAGRRNEHLGLVGEHAVPGGVAHGENASKKFSQRPLSLRKRYDSTCPTHSTACRFRVTHAVVERIHEGRTCQSGLPNLLQVFLVSFGTCVQSAGDRFEAGVTFLAHNTQINEGVIEPTEDASFHRINLNAARRGVRREATDEIAPQSAEQVFYRIRMRVGFPEAGLPADCESMIACISCRPIFTQPAHTGCPGMIRVTH